MRIGLVADVHLGNHRRHGGPVEASLNRRCREGLQVFRAAVQIAHAEGCESFVVLGDLLDSARPEPQLLAAIQDIIDPYALAHANRGIAHDDPAMRFHLLLGNHEMVSTSPRDHALGPLREVGVEVECSPTRALGALYLVPFSPDPAGPHIRESVRALSDADGRTWRAYAWDRVLAVCVHAGVRDARTPPWLRGAPDSVDIDELARVCAEAGARFAFAGNWHDRREWTRIVGSGEEPPREAACAAERLGAGVVRVYQLGALVPTGWDNPGHGYGALAIFDTDMVDPRNPDRDPERAVRVVEVPGPRFFTMRGYGGLEDWAKPDLDAYVARGFMPYFRVLVPPSELADAARSFEASGLRGEVLPEDDPEAAARARKGAVEARAAETLEEALAAWVGGAELAPGVDRAEVLSRARAYLSGAPR